MSDWMIFVKLIQNLNEIPSEINFQMTHTQQINELYADHKPQNWFLFISLISISVAGHAVIPGKPGEYKYVYELCIYQSFDDKSLPNQKLII